MCAKRHHFCISWLLSELELINVPRRMAEGPSVIIDLLGMRAESFATEAKKRCRGTPHNALYIVEVCLAGGEAYRRNTIFLFPRLRRSGLQYPARLMLIT